MFIKDGKTLNETNCTQEFAGTKDKCMSNKSRIPPYSYGYAKSIYEKLEKSYFDFFTGQVLESCILGTIMFFALSIAGIPYSVLIAVCVLVVL